MVIPLFPALDATLLRRAVATAELFAFSVVAVAGLELLVKFLSCTLYWEGSGRS